MTDRPTLPPFPVDDFTLDLLSEAVNVVITGQDDDGNNTYSGPFSLSKLLDFLSGYDPALSKPIDDDQEFAAIPIYEYPGQIYSRDCVIRALIAEVRRLRKASAETTEVTP